MERSAMHLARIVALDVAVFCEGDEAGAYAALAGLGIVWISARVPGAPDSSCAETEDGRPLGTVTAIHRTAKAR